MRSTALAVSLYRTGLNNTPQNELTRKPQFEVLFLDMRISAE
jgi:hypothetical protein